MAVAIRDTARPANGRLKLTLRQMSEEFLRLAYELEGLDPGDPEDTEQIEAIMARLQGSAGDYEDKVAAVACWIREHEKAAEIAKDEAARIAAFGKADERRADWLRGYLVSNMESTGCPSIKRNYISVTLADNQEALVVDDDARVPDVYTYPVRKVDNAAIKAALKRGEAVPGAYLRKGKHVVIR